MLEGNQRRREEEGGKKKPTPLREVGGYSNLRRDRP